MAKREISGTDNGISDVGGTRDDKKYTALCPKEARGSAVVDLGSQDTKEEHVKFFRQLVADEISYENNLADQWKNKLKVNDTVDAVGHSDTGNGSFRWSSVDAEYFAEIAADQMGALKSFLETNAYVSALHNGNIGK